MNALHQFVFGIYPYLALLVFLLGSLIRFEREQYSWRSESSQLIKRGRLRLGSTLFHIGILSLFFTHLVGLLTPKAAYHFFGLTPQAKQLMAIVGGALLGGLCLAGLLILIHRRLSEPRLRATTRPGDRLVIGWILITLLLGLVSIRTSTHHLDGETMVRLGLWAQHLATFRPDAAGFIADVPWIYKAHMFMGMTLFVIFPFTRLVHAWSGFGALAYLPRAWQLVRGR